MIFTIGYSKWDVKAVRAKMEEVRISLLVDLRSTPYGRFNPTFNRLALIAAFGARYVWKGDVLGGKPGPATEEGIEWLIEQHTAGGKLLLMCVEFEPRNCHRLTDIGARLFARGIDAVHLLHDGTEHTTQEYLGNLFGG